MHPEIHVYGRPGQGAELVCRILARACSRVAREMTAFVAPRGGRGPADYVIVLDPALLSTVAPSSLTGDTLVVVNAPMSPCSRLLGGYHIVVVDATAVIQHSRHRASLAAAMAGAFAAASGLVPLDELLFAIEDELATPHGAPVAVCAEAWAEMKAPGSVSSVDESRLQLAS